MDEGNAIIDAHDSLRQPGHVRSARFGTVFVTKDNDVIEMDARDILTKFIEEIDNRNLVLTSPLERHIFIQEMYVKHILGLRINDPFDLIRSNDVEDLTEHTEYYQLMQQYTIYPIYDLYKLSWNEFIRQSHSDIRFQLKMAIKYHDATKKISKDIEDEQKNVMVDETHMVDTISNQVVVPSFKKKF